MRERAKTIPHTSRWATWLLSSADPPAPSAVVRPTDVCCAKRLGGLLKHCHRREPPEPERATLTAARVRHPRRYRYALDLRRADPVDDTIPAITPEKETGPAHHDDKELAQECRTGCGSWAPAPARPAGRPTRDRRAGREGCGWGRPGPGRRACWLASSSWGISQYSVAPPSPARRGALEHTPRTPR